MTQFDNISNINPDNKGIDIDKMMKDTKELIELIRIQQARERLIKILEERLKNKVFFDNLNRDAPLINFTYHSPFIYIPISIHILTGV